ncbi:hypothetical protein ABTB44_20495, partial [Acinetobacter baumannii]
DGLDKLLIRNSSLKRADARVIARPAASVGQFDLQDAGLRCRCCDPARARHATGRAQAFVWRDPLLTVPKRLTRR